MTSPAHDVLPMVRTDYTDGSKHGIAEGIPLAFYDAASQFPEGGNGDVTSEDRRNGMSLRETNPLRV